MPIRLMLVDDHILIRAALAGILNATGDIQVIAEADNGQQALAQVIESGSQQYDILLMDIGMPEMDGFIATKELLKQFPSLNIIILSMKENVVFFRQLLAIGAKGYVLKDDPPTELIKAIYAVYEGKHGMTPRVIQKLAMDEVLNHPKAFSFAELSEQELAVVRLIVEGVSACEIAKRLQIRPRTVGTYRKRAFKKLKVSSNVELTKLALQEKII